MRTLRQNRRKIYYALYLRSEPVLDANGRVTGQHNPVYGEPVAAYVNISAGKSDAESRDFGISESYERTIIYAVGELPIDKNSVLWIDQLDITKPYDYICKIPITSLNSVIMPISKVTVPNGKKNQV